MSKLFYCVGILALALLAYSKITILPRSERYPQRKEIVLGTLSRQNSRIEQLLLKRRERPNFYDNTASFDLNIGTTIQAYLLNSIVSNNLESPILVEVSSGAVFPRGTRFSCSGSLKETRVHVSCKLIILEGQEYPLEAKVLNLDGSAGLKGEVFTGDDQRVVGVISTSIIKELANKIKNQHAKTIPHEVSQIVDKNSSTAQEAVIQIEAGYRVLIYLTKGFKR